MIRSAEEVRAHIEAIKKSWTKIEELHRKLKKKLILAHSVDLVEDIKKLLEELENILEIKTFSDQIVWYINSGYRNNSPSNVKILGKK